MSQHLLTNQNGELRHSADQQNNILEKLHIKEQNIWMPKNFVWDKYRGE